MIGERWSRKFEKCQKCGTNRFRHKARGLCARCYRLVRRMEEIGRWDQSNPKSLRRYPASSFEKFNQIKSKFMRQIRDRLERLEATENLLRGPVDGLMIEWQLRRIAELCGAKQHLLHQVNYTFDQNFDDEQRRLLFEVLNRIEENIPWKGLDFIRALRPDP